MGSEMCIRDRIGMEGGGNSDCKFITMILLVNKACKILADLTFCVSELALVRFGSL